jgi:hypothetical protein
MRLAHYPGHHIRVDGFYLFRQYDAAHVGGGLYGGAGSFTAPTARLATLAASPVFFPVAAADQGHGQALEAPVSLSAWEQRTLDSIKDELACSDPGLATLLVTFNRLASSEQMPAREEIRAGLRGIVPCSRRKWRHPRWGKADRVCQRVGLRWAALLLWLLISISLVTVALVLSRGSNQGACPQSWATVCADLAPVHSSHSAPHETGVTEAPGLGG